MKFLGTFAQAGKEGIDSFLSVLQTEDGQLAFQITVVRGPSGITQLAADDKDALIAVIQKFAPNP